MFNIRVFPNSKMVGKNIDMLEGYSSPLKVTSKFGWRTLKGVRRFHNGIDFACKSGTVLRSPVYGKVVFCSKLKGGGLTITIEQPAGEMFEMTDRGGVDGKQLPKVIYSEWIPDAEAKVPAIWFKFMHLSTISTNVWVGAKIKVGDVIGRTGGLPGQPNSGDSIGEHLHFEIDYQKTIPIDPLAFFMRYPVILKKTNEILYNGFANPVVDYKINSRNFITASSNPNSEGTIESETEAKTTPIIPTTTDERLATGIWQIIKILIDSSVSDRQILDSGMSVQQGSLLNFFRKVCQEPLVELMSDTWGDQYYFIVRKPPTDQESILAMMDLAMITLDDENIVSTDLGWNSQNIYSWYQFVSYDDYVGIKDQNIFTPAIFFPEYAAVWGSKPFCMESNYYSFSQAGDRNADKPANKNNKDNVYNNAVRDLKYIIQSHACSPFTRHGTITLNGDRRIKRGMFILHTSGEVFHVDSVTNVFSKTMTGVTRTTTLNVSGGMYPDFIAGKEINGKLYSYFNIIKFDPLATEDMNSQNYEKAMSQWKVDADVFNFFMRKGQLYDQQLLKSTTNG